MPESSVDELRRAHAQWLLCHKRRWPLCLFAAVAAAASWYMLLVGAARDRAAARLPYTTAAVRALAPPPVAASENAALVYRQAFVAVANWKSPDTDPSVRLAVQSPKSFERKSDARQLLASNAKALQLAEQAAGMRHCNWDSDYGQTYSMDDQHLRSLRKLMRLFALQAKVAAADNDWNLVERSLRVCCQIGDHAATDAPLMNTLVACTGESMAALAIEDALTVPGAAPPPETLQRLQAFAQARAGVVRPVETIMETEKQFVLLQIDRMGAGIMTGPARELPEEMERVPLLFNWYGLVCEADRRACQDGFELLKSDARAALAEFRSFDDSKYEKLSIRSHFGFEQMTARMLPMFGHAPLFMLRCRVQWHLAVAGLAALRWRQSHDGKWPAALDDLGLDAVILKDPFDRESGRIRCKTDTKDGALWLWSVSTDGKDDSESQSKSGSDPIARWRDNDVVFRVPPLPPAAAQPAAKGGP
ncbi:MAG: hypothetical protein NTW87_15740 [Planctomycetota bacterium]|nr:hypothetical protein [Planctomycetota bacterium]